ncbi:unnamed protein product [Mucor circinelloides]|uniref:DH domain-containing protein n=1 Tax=Mucor circinelloides f. circinelloides (strain 1006PhL) TaxID=1220926 RepID=S2J118_MUCC1|nr:hypothetical protein HMPREF1544_09507 [Mucor circinelloides 1006PhL]
MSIDVCKNNSILLKKATAAASKNDSTNDTKTKKNRSSSFSKLQTLVASVSRRRTKQKGTLESKSNVSLPQPQSSPMPQLPPPNLKLKPSLSARPFSQFFFPSVKEEEDEEPSNIPTRATIARQISFSPPSPRQKQQQTKNRQLSRHSIAIDITDRQQQQTEESGSSSSSSRSSSLKTIRLLDDFIIKEEDEVEEEGQLINTVQSDIALSSTSIKRDYCISRSISQNKEKRLSGVVNVARARTVLGLDSLKSKETRAIHVWKNTITQLLSANPDQDCMLDNDKRELYKIMAHPALIPEDPLERQRFVRQSSPKDLAMVKFILNELIETEKSYNQLLVLIQDRYMRPMLAASQSKDPLVKSTDIPILFNHLPELVQLSDKLLQSFQSTNNVGKVFRSFESSFVVFLKYAMHYRTNIKTIKRACSNVLFIKIDQENLSRRDTNRLGMSDYFIAPIQRIPRYCLMIKDLQKYVHPFDTNYVELDLALKILTGLAVAMDYAQNKAPPPSRSSIGTI